MPLAAVLTTAAVTEKTERELSDHVITEECVVSGSRRASAERPQEIFAAGMLGPISHFGGPYHQYLKYRQMRSSSSHDQYLVLLSCPSGVCEFDGDFLHIAKNGDSVLVGLTEAFDVTYSNCFKTHAIMKNSAGFVVTSAQKAK